ncbi:unnamed protein product [Angiostrongylus costaricensis]|uniref:Spondin domain-containing protein n=1 Tax=Angiostrongylus costaricensis TaxID=334426 RepID=A0A0R3PZE2_ANGCS|nr:unnamed protein product [Angiostrongylus costaricensis]
MFEPSPDWCMRITSVNLCLPDLFWLAEEFQSPTSSLDPRVPSLNFFSCETLFIGDPMRYLPNDEYQREAFNITNTSEDEEYKERR